MGSLFVLVRSRPYRFDAHSGEVLAMAVGLLVLLAPLLFEDDYLFAAAMFDNGALYMAASESDLNAVSDCLEKCIKLDRCADFSIDRRNAHDLAFGHAELFAARLNDRVCHC